MNIFNRKGLSFGDARPLSSEVKGVPVMAVDRIAKLLKSDQIKMSATAVISTPNSDRDGDEILQNGLIWDNYRRNPIVFLNHKTEDLPVGKSEDDQGNFTVVADNDQTLATCYFSKSLKIAEQVFHLVVEQIIRATSIGFLVRKAVPLTGGGGLGIARMTNSKRPSFRIMEAEVTEWSWCGVGVNPDALAVYLGKGFINGSAIDERLARALEPYAAKGGVFVPTGGAIELVDVSDAATSGGVCQYAARLPNGEVVPIDSITKGGNFDPKLHPRGGNPKNTGEFSKKEGAKVQKVTPEEFIKAKGGSERSAFLSDLSAEDIKDHLLFLNDEGKIGVATSPEGDVQNVFNNGGRKGGATDVLVHAIEEGGGKTLDCFAGFLPGYYSCFGFNETGRMKFNREYAPPGWDFDKYGEPDVVFMARTEALSRDEIEARLKAWSEGGRKQPEPGENYYDGAEWDKAKSDSRGAVEKPGRKALGEQGSLDTGAGECDGGATLPGVGGRLRPGVVEAVEESVLETLRTPFFKMMKSLSRVQGALRRSAFLEQDVAYLPTLITKKVDEHGREHEPAGRSTGGQFTSKRGGSGWKPTDGATRSEADKSPALRAYAHSEGVTKENLHGLWSKLRNMADGVPEGLGKRGQLIGGTTNKNAKEQIKNLDRIRKKIKRPFTVKMWNRMQAAMFGTRDVPVAPFNFLKKLNNGTLGDELKKLKPGQLADADHGFENAREFRKLYTSGKVGVETTGKLLLWSILSRGVSPYTQESLFIDAYDGAEKWIKLAAEGKLTDDQVKGKKIFDEDNKPVMEPVTYGFGPKKGEQKIDKKTGKPMFQQAREKPSEYEVWAKSVAPKGEGIPGAGSTHNLGAFGKNLLWNLSKKNKETGKSYMQEFHDMLCDPNQTGRGIRRKFAEFGQGVGIDNKVVSFTLLVAGFDDVMVLDRVQMGNLWDDGRFKNYNLYDGIKTQKAKKEQDKGGATGDEVAATKSNSVKGSALNLLGNGVRGLAYYEAVEDAIREQLPEMSKKLGREMSIGRYHWESWVAKSGQEASHGTLGAILSDARGEDSAIAKVQAKQGEYSSYQYGSRYGRNEDGERYIDWAIPGVIKDEDGGEHIGATNDAVRFTIPEFRQFMDHVSKKRGKDGVITPHLVDKDGNPRLDKKKNKIKFNVTDENYEKEAWYGRPEVDREKLVRLAKEIAKEHERRRSNADADSPQSKSLAADSYRAIEGWPGIRRRAGGSWVVLVPVPPTGVKSMNAASPSGASAEMIPPGLAFIQAQKELMEAALSLQENPEVKTFIMGGYSKLHELCEKTYPDCKLEWTVKPDEKMNELENKEKDKDEILNEDEDEDWDIDEDEDLDDEPEDEDDEDDLDFDDDEEDEDEDEDEEDEEDDDLDEDLKKSLRESVNAAKLGLEQVAKSLGSVKGNID